MKIELPKMAPKLISVDSICLLAYVATLSLWHYEALDSISSLIKSVIQDGAFALKSNKNRIVEKKFEKQTRNTAFTDKQNVGQQVEPDIVVKSQTPASHLELEKEEKVRRRVARSVEEANKITESQYGDKSKKEDTEEVFHEGDASEESAHVLVDLTPAVPENEVQGLIKSDDVEQRLDSTELQYDSEDSEITATLSQPMEKELTDAQYRDETEKEGTEEESTQQEPEMPLEVLTPTIDQILDPDELEYDYEEPKLAATLSQTLDNDLTDNQNGDEYKNEDAEEEEEEKSNQQKPEVPLEDLISTVPENQVEDLIKHDDADQRLDSAELPYDNEEPENAVTPSQPVDNELTEDQNEDEDKNDETKEETTTKESEAPLEDLTPSVDETLVPGELDHANEEPKITPTPSQLVANELTVNQNGDESKKEDAKEAEDNEQLTEQEHKTPLEDLTSAVPENQVEQLIKSDDVDQSKTSPAELENEDDKPTVPEHKTRDESKNEDALQGKAEAGDTTQKPEGSQENASTGGTENQTEELVQADAADESRTSTGKNENEDKAASFGPASSTSANKSVTSNQSGNKSLSVYEPKELNKNVDEYLKKLEELKDFASKIRRVKSSDMAEWLKECERNSGSFTSMCSSAFSTTTVKAPQNALDAEPSELETTNDDNLDVGSSKETKIGDLGDLEDDENVKAPQEESSMLEIESAKLLRKEGEGISCCRNQDDDYIDCLEILR